MLNSFIKKMMMSHQLSLGEGRAELLGFRMAFMPTHTLATLVEEMYKQNGDAAFDLMFETGRKHGHYAIDVLGKEHNIPKKQFAEQTFDSINTLGLGKFSLEMINIAKSKMVIRLTDSPFVEEFRESDIIDTDRPVDGFQCGILHGVAEHLFDDPVETEEVQCEYHSGSHCEIRTRPADTA